MSLGTVDDGGPWVSDVGYVHDVELNLYWISRKDRRHSVALRNNPAVAVSITVSTLEEKDLGLQIAGVAEELTSPPSIVPDYWKKRGKKPQRPITNEHTWYRLKPTKIELIDEANFAHEKQVLTF